MPYQPPKKEPDLNYLLQRNKVEILSAVNAMMSQQRSQPALEEYVPRPKHPRIMPPGYESPPPKPASVKSVRGEFSGQAKMSSQKFARAFACCSQAGGSQSDDGQNAGKLEETAALNQALEESWEEELARLQRESDEAMARAHQRWMQKNAKKSESGAASRPPSRANSVVSTVPLSGPESCAGSPKVSPLMITKKKTAAVKSKKAVDLAKAIGLAVDARRARRHQQAAAQANAPSQSTTPKDNPDDPKLRLKGPGKKSTKKPDEGQ